VQNLNAIEMYMTNNGMIYAYFRVIVGRSPTTLTKHTKVL